ncbi:MAG: molybdenum cofactor guanylyltransferase [Niabella sp.]
MIGLILCGGLSSRMGSDKGLLKTETTNWALEATNKLIGLNIPIKVSINSLQQEAYKDALPDTEFITDNVALPVRGPLLGLLSAHIAYPTEDILALACDMPLMTSFLLKELYRTYKQQQADSFLYSNNGEPEPLCAIYTTSALQKIIAMLQQGKLVKFSMKFTLDHLNCFMLPIPEENKKYFHNFNAHADLNGL